MVCGLLEFLLGRKEIEMEINKWKFITWTSLCPLPFNMLRVIFKVLSDKSVLMKCRNKQNWHKYCGSLEPGLGNSSLESKSLKSCLNQNHKESLVYHITSCLTWQLSKVVYNRESNFTLHLCFYNFTFSKLSNKNKWYPV